MLLTHQSIHKGLPTTVTLSKTDLFAIVSPISEYFSVATNVKDVLVIYESDVGNQREVLRFDLTQTSPTATFLVSLKARDTFLLAQLILNDFDNRILTIDRNQLSSLVLSENGSIILFKSVFTINSNIISSFNSQSSSPSPFPPPPPISTIVLVTTGGSPQNDELGNNINLVYSESYIQFQNGTKIYATSANGDARPSHGTQLNIVNGQLVSNNAPTFNYGINFYGGGTSVSLLFAVNQILMNRLQSSEMKTFRFYPSTQPYAFASVG